MEIVNLYSTSAHQAGYGATMPAEAREPAIQALLDVLDEHRSNLRSPSFPKTDEERLNAALDRVGSYLFYLWTYDCLTPIDEVQLGKLDKERNETIKGLKGMPYFQTQMSTVIDDLTGMYVRRCRTLGLSWKQIGEALQMTPAGVYKRAGNQGWVPEAELNAEAEPQE